MTCRAERTWQAGSVAVDLRPLCRWVVEDLEPEVRLDRPGHYAREVGAEVLEVYGTADMACVLHTLGRLEPDVGELDGWSAAFEALQDPTSGWFVERTPSHLPEHATAFAVAAMALIGLRPRHRLVALDPVRSPDDFGRWLEGMDWRDWVYLESHRGAGVASLHHLLPEEAEPGWEEVYLRVLDRHLDPANGMHGDGKPPGGDLDQVGGTFHHLFVLEHLGRPLDHAEARLRSVAGLQRDDGLWDPANPWWLTLDGVYLLGRAADEVPDEAGTARAAIARAVRAVGDRLCTDEARRAAFGVDMGVHALTGVLTMFAEAQRVLGPDEVRTDVALRNVLDERPFV